eukprot:4020128-Lingulodinium_polyedra.AAC.1
MDYVVRTYYPNFCPWAGYWMRLVCVGHGIGSPDFYLEDPRTGLIWVCTARRAYHPRTGLRIDPPEDV